MSILVAIVLILLGVYLLSFFDGQPAGEFLGLLVCLAGLIGFIVTVTT